MATDRYEPGAEVARGGMGAVLEAEDRSLRRRVAVKVMLNPDAGSEERARRFVAEARVTGQLEHPGIVPVYELGTDAAGRIFYAMKLVRGTTLSAILAGLREGDPETLAKHPLGALLTAFLKVCDAVSFAHSRGVIHRDLKPDNIMVGDYGEVLVMDWGLAKVVGGAEQGAPSVENGGTGPSDLPGRSDSSAPGAADPAPVMTLEGQILGTPAYMAPEQARGEVSAIDARTDIYALGAILYALLVLRPPFVGRTPWEILENVLRGEATPPATHNRTGGQTGEVPAEPRSRLKPVHQPMLPPLVYRLQAASRTAGLFHPARGSAGASGGSAARPFPHCPGGRVPEALSHVAVKALAAAPADRYQSVTELQADIEAWRGGFATAAEEAGLWRQLALLVRRHRVVAMASLAVLLAFATGLSGALVQWRRAVAGEARARAGEDEARNNETRALASETRQRETALAVARRLAMQAVRAAEAGAWEEAELGAQDAEAAAPDGPWAAYARGTAAAVREDHATAADRFRLALAADPAHLLSTAGLAGALSGLGDTSQAVDLAATAVSAGEWRALLQAVRVLYASERRALCREPLEQALDLMQRELPPGTRMRKMIAEEIRSMLDDVNAEAACEGFVETIASLPAEQQRDRIVAKLGEINGVPCAMGHTQPGGNWMAVTVGATDIARRLELRFLHPLRGLPLEALRVSGTGVRDLWPLRGMPLRDLRIHSSPVQDLRPLRGLPLRELTVQCTQVRDLGPLRDLPLETLDCGGCREITDLSPLAGMQLKRLDLWYTRIADLAPLRDLPLEALYLGATPVADLAPLRGMPLKTLHVWKTGVSDLSPLAGMPLRELCCWGNRVSDLSPLRGMPLTVLEVHETQVCDLSPLQGAPLALLRCDGTKVTDLAPLRSMPLTYLDFSDCDISDLTPLAGMPIQRLYLRGTHVADLAPLAEMPLIDLRFHATRVSDLTPLAGMKLQIIAFTPKNIVAGVEIVRQMHALQQIALSSDPPVTYAPEDFWQRYDAGEFR
jgi:serine/threonine protein kinase/Leucine-rich repeat (LRR) protein